MNKIFHVKVYSTTIERGKLCLSEHNYSNKNKGQLTSLMKDIDKTDYFT